MAEVFNLGKDHPLAWIRGYGCSTAAGPSTPSLWTSLITGQNHSKPYLHSKAYKWSERKETFRSTLLCELRRAWNEAWDSLSPSLRARLKNESSYGIILASTKGYIDDVINSDSNSASYDALTPLLDDFIAAEGLRPNRHLCVSNACASSLSAVALAKTWMRRGLAKDVIVIAADAVGPFVMSGFESLRVLTSDETRPFDRNRSGFYLGEACAALVLSSEQGDARLSVKNVGVDAEGYAVTRPSQSGESLQRACLQALTGETSLDLIIAHGTATAVNDAVEDHALFDVIANIITEKKHRPLITASKWCIGHTLGASGAIDLILASEALKRQTIFKIATTSALDPNLKCQYALSHEENRPLRNALVTSLGFGGIHAALFLSEERGAHE